MAEEPAETTKKRIVKNPETFRERAIKAAASSDEPTRSSRLKQASRQAVIPVARPVGSAAGKVFGLKPVRLLRQPLRLIGKIIFPTYFRSSWRELRQVTWPNWYESRRLTYAVLIFAILFGAIIAVVDYGLDKVFRNVLLK